MDTLAWLQILSLAAFCGALGQSARSVVGIKKLYDEAGETGRTLSEVFVPSRLVIAIILGATVGAIAAIPMTWTATVEPSQLLSLIAAGYSGADFLEGLMSRYLPKVPAATDGAANVKPAATGEPAAPRTAATEIALG